MSKSFESEPSDHHNAMYPSQREVDELEARATDTEFHKELEAREGDSIEKFRQREGIKDNKKRSGKKRGGKKPHPGFDPPINTPFSGLRDLIK